MAFKRAFLASLLLASVALAVPSPHLEAHLTRRRASHLSGPVREAKLSANGVRYTDNWAGAVWEKGDETFNAVTGTFTVPTISGKSGASGAAAWVGIDGYTCQNVILQTGVQFTVGMHGETVARAWYEWFPDYAHYFTGINISPGDAIKATVFTFNATSGAAFIENMTTGQIVHENIISDHALCEQNAEWIVEDYSEDGTLIPLADFGTVTFSDALAFTRTGPALRPSGGSILDIEKGKAVLTSVSANGDGVTIKYV